MTKKKRVRWSQWLVALALVVAVVAWLVTPALAQPTKVQVTIREVRLMPAERSFDCYLAGLPPPGEIDVGDYAGSFDCGFGTFRDADLWPIIRIDQPKDVNDLTLVGLVITNQNTITPTNWSRSQIIDFTGRAFIPIYIMVREQDQGAANDDYADLDSIPATPGFPNDRWLDLEIATTTCQWRGDVNFPTNLSQGDSSFTVGVVATRRVFIKFDVLCSPVGPPTLASSNPANGATVNTQQPTISATLGDPDGVNTTTFFRMLVSGCPIEFTLARPEVSVSGVTATSATFNVNLQQADCTLPTGLVTVNVFGSDLTGSTTPPGSPLQFSFTVQPGGGTPPARISGDVNGDGVVNLADLARLDAAISGTSPLSPAEFERADVSKKCGVNTAKELKKDRKAIAKFVQQGRSVKDKCVPGLLVGQPMSVPATTTAHFALGDAANARVQVFDLTGRTRFDSGFVARSALNAIALEIEQTLANGVYLYVVTVQTSDGATRRDLRKLVVAR